MKTTNRKLEFEDKVYDYRIKKYRKAKSIKLIIHHDGSVVLTMPYWLPFKAGEKFANDRASWIASKISALDPNNNGNEYYLKKELARSRVEEKIIKFNAYYRFSYNKLSIKKQKNCWGSCSSKRNLNFNYKTAFLPDKLFEYVVVHELCHLSEMNHSKRFWDLVSETLSNPKKLRKELKNIKC